MEKERNEVYERIPWETLEQKSPDRQWMLFVVAGAIVLGAVAYSFMSNRPVAPAPSATPEITADLAAPVVTVPPVIAPLPVPATAGPEVISEADLYAIEPARLLDQATAHAEWFVAEFFTLDGSEESTQTLASLLPTGIPAPTSEDDARVFVEWVRAVDVEQIGPLRFRVSVLVRSLRADGDDVYVRQAPMMAVVDVEVDETGPRIMLPPTIEKAESPEPATTNLEAVPDDIAGVIAQTTGSGEIVGGIRLPDGGWQVVVMAVGPDGVIRPQTVTVP